MTATEALDMLEAIVKKPVIDPAKYLEAKDCIEVLRYSIEYLETMS